jgi:hypothetical protein
MVVSLSLNFFFPARKPQHRRSERAAELDRALDKLM